jgi:hypothetical protein
MVVMKLRKELKDLIAGGLLDKKRMDHTILQREETFNTGFDS